MLVDDGLRLVLLIGAKCGQLTRNQATRARGGLRQRCLPAVDPSASSPIAPTVNPAATAAIDPATATSTKSVDPPTTATAPPIEPAGNCLRGECSQMPPPIAAAIAAADHLPML